MPRNGSGVYSLPGGSVITNGDTSDASDINTPLADLVTDANAARPIVAGGTGATSAADALTNLGLTATAAEINILDGVTSTAAELNILDGVTATASELNLLDGVTATTAELNLLDGVTATTTELNHVDGVTSNVQDQLDDKAEASGTSGASVTTSGTQVTVTGIPSGVTRVTMLLNFVSTTGTAPVEVRLGAGAIAASGYSGTTTHKVDASATTDVSSSTGFSLGGISAGSSYVGFLTLEGRNGTTWYASYTIRSGAATVVGAGYISFGSSLDRVAIATDGVDTFDNGFIDVKWSY